MIIVGCGRLGSLLANRLSKAGYSVVVIDQSQEAFKRLSLDFSGFKLLGDASQFSVLQLAKTADASVLWAMTENENLNLMVAQIAVKNFGVKKAFARVYDQEKEAIFQKAGIETICPTRLASDKALELLDQALGCQGD